MGCVSFFLIRELPIALFSVLAGVKHVPTESANLETSHTLPRTWGAVGTYLLYHASSHVG